MSSSTPNKAKSIIFPKNMNKSQEKSLIVSENEATKPMDQSDFSAKKPVKRLRAWCGDCFQSFEFGPFAKVCQQHVIKKNCNVFECKKKLINPNLSKNCIRKFANINSENRHTYCIDEAEMHTWDPRLKIQNCLTLGENSRINFSSNEKNRKNSFDSIKFSDLNLDLMENSELIFDNFNTSNGNNNNTNKNNNNNNNFSSNYGSSEFNSHMSKKNKLNNHSGSSYLNKKTNNNVLENHGKNKNTNFVHERKNKEEALKFRSPGKISESAEIRVNKKADNFQVVSTLKMINNSDGDYNANIFENENKNKINELGFKAIEYDVNSDLSLLGKNKRLDYKKSENKSLETNETLNEDSFESKEYKKKGFKKRNILRKRQKSKSNISKKKAKLQLKGNKNKYSIEADSIDKPKSYGEKDKENCIQEESKEGIVNVNGLIDQIGNLKFENSKNDSIIEDEILIKQFDNIYFNYNKNKTECEIISLNDSNLELLSAKNVRIEEDFDFLNNSNFNFNFNSNSNANSNGNFNEVCLKSSNLPVFKNHFNSANKKLEEANNIKQHDSEKSKKENSNNNFLFKKQTNIDLSFNLNRIENGDNCLIKLIKDNNQENTCENKKQLKTPVKSAEETKLEDAVCNPLDYATQEDKNNSNNGFNDTQSQEYREENLKLAGKEIESDKSFSDKVTGNIQSKNSLLIVDHNHEAKLEERENFIPKIKAKEDQNFSKIPANIKLIRDNREASKSPKNHFSLESQNFEIPSYCNNQIYFLTKQTDSLIKDRERSILAIKNSIELNFLPVHSKNKNFADSNLIQEKIESLAFEPKDAKSDSEFKNKIYKISDDAHIDKIMLLAHDKTGIPGKVLSKLKDAMKKKGIFNARMLRLFKKKKQSWNFIKKDFAKNCTQIEAICIYLGELLEE